MICTDYRLFIYLCRCLQHPIRSIFLLKTASVTDEIFYLSVLILTGSNTQHLFALIPQGYLSATCRTVAMCIHRLGKPHPVLEAERFVGQRTYSTHIDDIADEVFVQSFFYIGRNFRMVTTV